MQAETRNYDVAIIGGALAGASAAILLLREKPDLRVLVMEKSEQFGRRVGEATVEVSGYFLTKVLGLTQHLNESHLVKQGMRFWFFNEHTKSLDECSEVGGLSLARLPAFQVDRSVLDQEVLNRAIAAGAELWRPADVQNVELKSGGVQKIHAKVNCELRTAEARWVIDASGVAALLARKNGWLKPNTEHPTAALWSRWRHVKDWDGRELAEKFPMWHQACYGIRATATNHLVGDGWWAWLIPLKGGDTSIGVVFDQRTVQIPEGGSLGERLKRFLCAHPAGHEIMRDAQWIEGDVHWRKNLPYVSSVFAGDGFALVGDAAAFLDPFYSPGMDWVSFTTISTAKLILSQFKGECIKERVAKHNKLFARSYDRWFRAVYKDKYDYMGEYDLMRLAFAMDIGLYYMGVVAQPFRRGTESFLEPLFATGPSTPVYMLMRQYNKRLALIARDRRARGMRGKTNNRQRYLVPGFNFGLETGNRVGWAMIDWFKLELKEGWRTWFPSPARVRREEAQRSLLTTS
jgi:flavin-dependent dehydrogenase